MRVQKGFGTSRRTCRVEQVIPAVGVIAAARSGVLELVLHAPISWRIHPDSGVRGPPSTPQPRPERPHRSPAGVCRGHQEVSVGSLDISPSPVVRGCTAGRSRALSARTRGPDLGRRDGIAVSGACRGSSSSALRRHRSEFRDGRHSGVGRWAANTPSPTALRYCASSAGSLPPKPPSTQPLSAAERACREDVPTMSPPFRTSVIDPDTGPGDFTLAHALPRGPTFHPRPWTGGSRHARLGGSRSRCGPTRRTARWRIPSRRGPARLTISGILVLVGGVGEDPPAEKAVLRSEVALDVDEAEQPLRLRAPAAARSGRPSSARRGGTGQAP
jgi:hypothetical protein